MRVFKGTAGMLKKTYDFRNTMVILKSKTFLCRRIVKIDRKTIIRAIKSDKYMIKYIEQNNKSAFLSYDFAKANGFAMDNYQLTKNYDTCGIYAYKNIVNGKEIVEMCLIKTYKDKHSTSISLYYLPNGSVRDATFIARICKHDLVEHVNDDGTRIKAGDIHLHVTQEKDFDDICKKYRNKGEKVLLEKLQSPRAITHKGLKEEDMESYAKKLFHIQDKTLEIISNVKQKNGYYIENGILRKGESDYTVTNEIKELL